MATVQPQSFAHVLRRARLAAGLTQEALAERAGLAVRSISDLERGLRRAPYKATVILLAEALHLSEAERAAFEAAASGNPAPAAPRTPPPAARHYTSMPPPFVGRQREMERLEQHLIGDAGAQLVLAGEPGIGKSRLLRETAAHAEAVGWAVVEGGCTRRSGQELYAPLVGALARHTARVPVARLRADLQGCAWLVRLLPELAERVVVPLPEWTLAPEQERRLMFAAVSRFLSNSAGPAGTLLVLDDLQWAGVDALDLLESLLRAGPEHPLRVVGAYRSTEVLADSPLGLLLADLARDGLAAELAIGPLDDRAARELVERLLPSEADNGGESTGRAESGQRLVARAGGLPFFLVSGARALASGAATDVPWDVSQSIRQRVSALPEATQELLGAAAVAGRVVPGALLLALADRPERDTLAALKAACKERLVVETSRAEYTFVHDLVRETVEAALSQGERAAWHRRIAQWLAGLPERDRRAAEIAQHYVESDQRGRALPYALAAGDHAEASYAHAEAEGHYRMALALAQEENDRAREAVILDKLAYLYGWSMGRFAGAIEVHEQAVAASQRSGDLDREVRLTVQLCRIYARAGNARRGLERLSPLLKVIESGGHREQQGDPTPARAALLAAAADIAYHAGDYQRQLENAEQAIALARQAKARAVHAEAQSLAGIALGLLGQGQTAVRTLRQAIALAESTGDIFTCSLALRHLADCYERSGEFTLAGAAIARGLEYADRLGHLTQRGIMAYRKGLHAFYLGNWAEMRTWYERAANLFTQVKSDVDGSVIPLTYSYVPFMHGHIGLIASEHDSGAQSLEEAIALSKRNGSLHVARRAQREVAEADLVRGDALATRNRLESLVSDHQARQHTDITPLRPLLAWAYLELDQYTSAQAALKEAAEIASVQHHQLAMLDVQRIQAMLAIHLHKWSVCIDILEAVLAAYRRMPYPYAEAKALWVYGQLEMARSQPARARERYERALAILNRLGERLYAEHVERALANLSGELH